MNLQKSRKFKAIAMRFAAIALAVVIIAGVLPNVIPSAVAAQVDDQPAVSTTDIAQPIDDAVSTGDKSEEVAEAVSPSDSAPLMLLGAELLAEDDIAEGECGNCTWVIDDAGVLTISPADGVSGVLANPNGLYYNSWGWYDYRSDVKKVVVKSGVSCNSNVSCMFYHFDNCRDIDISNLDTSSVTDMFAMFLSCSSLTALDVSGFDTSKVTNMESMFDGCSSLTALDVSGFDTSKVTNMNSMFEGCSSLTALDVSGFDTSKVTNMSYMFHNCRSLTELNVSGFDTSNVTNMCGMFNMGSVFNDGNLSLTELDVSGFDTSKVIYMDDMFSGCRNVTKIDVSSWDTSSVTDMSGMFAGCSSLTELGLSGFDTSNVTDMSYMFAGCSSLTELDLSGFDTSNVTDMWYMFYNCRSVTELDVSGFDTSKVTNTSYMFDNCSSLIELDVSGFDTSNVTDMSNMFAGCKSVVKIDVSADWKPASNYQMYANINTFNVVNGNLIYKPQSGYAVRSVTIHDGDTDVSVDLDTYPDSYPAFSGDMTATIIFDLVYTVTFLDNGTVVDTQTVFEGEDAADPYADEEDIPIVSGKKYIGWDKSFVDVKENITVNAVYSATSYTVKFDSNGGIGTMADQSFTHGTAQNLTANNFSKIGYNFLGWAENSAATSAVYADEESVLDLTDEADAVVILYAVWGTNTYTVKYDPNGGEGSMEDQSFAYGEKQNLRANSFSREGHTFLGWTMISTKPTAAYANEEEVWNLTTENNGTVTLYAVWEVNTYTIDFDVNGGDALAADKQTKTVTYTLPVGELPAATRTGYTFDGWFDGNGTKYTADTVYNVQADTTLTAQWTINEYDIVYNVVGEKPNKAVVPANATVEHGDAYAAVTPAAISGYTFDGWYTNESCTTKFADNTVITEDTDLYGKWTRNLITVSGTKTWAENGEGFVRPDSITVDLYQNDVFLKSTDIAKDESATTQNFSFEGLYETDEDGNPYVYTVKEHTTPDGYVTVVSNYDITNTYNVDTFIISKNWDNTGNPDELPASVDVELYSDDTLYKTVTLTEANGWSQTVTVPRLSAQGHTFTIKEIAVPGFSSTYETPATKDTDGDGVVDTITYVINNTYIMPQITVSGDIAWDKVPDGMTEPDMTVNLVLNDTVIDSVTVSAGVTAYSFDELDRYDDEGNVLAYTVEVEEIADYDVVTTAPATDADGNIDIDITATGTFTYGALTISNTVTGEDAPADAEFTYTVTFDSTVSYPYTGSATGTIKSGDKITLKNGESITIANILVGVKFDVTQDEAENFVTSPSTRKIEGVISATPSVAAFSNAYNPPVVTGNLEISNKVTGNNADTTLKFPFKVEFDAAGSYEYKIVNSKTKAVTTVKSGDTIELAHGETVIIYGLPVGTTYKVTETNTHGYKMTSTGDSGTVSAEGSKAAFINEKNKSSGGDTNVPDTGDYGTGETVALYVMQIAMLAMLMCVYSMKKLRRNKETEQF